MAPTGASEPSPLFGATPFSQRVVLFEEFGLQDYNDASGAPKSEDPKQTMLPPPVDPVTGEIDCQGNPVANGDALDNLIKNELLYPAAQEYSDMDTLGASQNPWTAQITNCVPGTTAGNLPMNGRPGGVDFAHQRWNEKNAKTGDLEFQPKKFFQAIMAGARASGGARDDFQSHGYGSKIPAGKFSEFAPGGLYYNTVLSPEAAAKLDTIKDDMGNDTGKHPFDGTTKGIPVQVHPNMPVQDRNSVWTFDGTIPAKLLMARYGETILFRHHNALPIDIAANNGFGTHTISTHEHNGHNPAESDGFAGAFFYPGQFYDYRWPMALAGHDTINKSANDPRAAAPCGLDSSGRKETAIGGFPCVWTGDVGYAQVPGDYRETMGTHWFHDHMLDFTAQNVYKGNAAMMNYYSRIDRGNEEINDGVNLRFPSGAAKDWGNRDYDVNLVVADKAFDQNGQLMFNPLPTDGFLGDVMTVNWAYKPYLDVRARKYRFRILNGSVSRYMKIAVAYQDPTTRAISQLPVHLIANDGNLLQHTVAFPNAAGGEGLPTQSIAERYDIIVDFNDPRLQIKDATGKITGYKTVYFVNLMEHANGAGPAVRPQGLAAAFDAFNSANKNAYKGQDPAIGKFMEFRVRALPAGQTDKSMNPADYVEGKKVLQALPTFTADELNRAKHRSFVYGKKALDDVKPWTIATDGGPDLNADINRISAAPTKDSLEIWHMRNPSAGWSHPAHIHFEEGQIIYRDGLAPPAWERLGRKDMFRIGPEIHSSGQVDVAIRVRDFVGAYVEHCHNTQHEDQAMLLRWDSETADHAKWVRTPYPEWNGANYDSADPAYHGLGPTIKVPAANTGSTKTDAKTGLTSSSVLSFRPPVNWGVKLKSGLIDPVSSTNVFGGFDKSMTPAEALNSLPKQ